MAIKKIISITLLLALLLFSGCTFNQPPETDGFAAQPYEPPAGTLVQKQGVETLLIIGISYDSQYQSLSSSLLLAVLDRQASTLTLCSIPRDTRTLITRYLDDGSTNRQYESIKNAYGAGEGLQRGEQNTLEAVESLLGGIKVDHYMVMNSVQLDQIGKVLGDTSISIDAVFAESHGLELGTIVINEMIGEYASYAERDSFGRLYPGTDEYMLTRQRYLFSGCIQTFAASADQAEIAAQINEIVRCSMNDGELAAFLLGCASVKDGSMQHFMLFGSDRPSGQQNEFIPDQQRVKEWILASFYEELG